jgi:hypothetical protein
MVWGGVSQHHRTELFVIAGNLKLCITGKTSSSLMWYPSCRGPCKEPDLNPIEHVWDLLDRRVRARATPLCSGTHYSHVSHMSVELVQFMKNTKLLNFMFIQIFPYVLSLLKMNAVDRVDDLLTYIIVQHHG